MLDPNMLVVLGEQPEQRAAVTLMELMPRSVPLCYTSTSQHTPSSLMALYPNETHGNCFIRLKLFPSRQPICTDPAASLALCETKHWRCQNLYVFFATASCGDK